jgi:hypothetical protein
MKKFKVEDIYASLGLFLDEIIEAKDDVDAKEQIMMEICKNIGNYVDIELEEIIESDDEDK